MQLSDKPTNYILVKATTESEWDSCDFAILSLSDNWRKTQLERLEAIQPFANDLSFLSMQFFDGTADFYRFGSDGFPDINELLKGKEWAFVESTQEEQRALTPPKSYLTRYKMVLYSNGIAYYIAYDKYTDEEFLTSELRIREILEKL